MKFHSLFLVVVIFCFFASCNENSKNPEEKNNTKSGNEIHENAEPSITQDEYFSVTFPSKPKVSVKETDTEFGIRKVTMYDLDYKGSRMQFIFSDYPQLIIELGGTEDIINGVLDVVASQTGSILLNDSTINISGKEAGLYEFKSGEYYLKIAIFFVENRLYQILYRIILESDNSIQEDFLKSFSLKLK
ncbi:MAG: hypothetical protein JXR58_03790 [Bacteroidales bacterium]|nr:hypothetical protein [Bacteroidales bacterium]